MKIWFDISNSPHINMFYELIQELEENGHTIIITSRPLANTVELLDQRGMTHTVVGEHYGKSLLKKIFGYPIRVVQLRKFLNNHKPDLAVSQSSFHSPVVARLLKVPSIYTNDNEHALGNLISFLCATRVLIPESLPIRSVAKLGISSKKIKQYPGVKEGIYLWSKGRHIHEARTSITSNVPEIYVRPEPQTAQYYKGKENFLDEVILELQSKYKIFVLPRDTKQAKHYKQSKFHSTIVPDRPLSFDHIASNCTVFIGAGGSMTREMAILGIPTISVYQDDLLEVDQLLIKKKLMLHSPCLTAPELDNYIKHSINTSPALELMQKGKLAYNLLKREILKFEKHD
ncbi:DUF354 domain-containing protein [Pontibacter anaerobius]|uniref:DUF354 domain-containing protein n=1 Tax=Pontibacter anaerobius TaxID=2993940 RepID=A0ABT3RGN6_9BACT|nr:DUF354 domain-containing protein [Pontibacter anaerobius]MCX2740984.1 DUF354 domain-containing protein [Pontibacter anaerobius]